MRIIYINTVESSLCKFISFTKLSIFSFVGRRSTPEYKPLVSGDDGYGLNIVSNGLESAFKLERRLLCRRLRLALNGRVFGL